MSVKARGYTNTWDYNQFAFNSYNLTSSGSWCVKPKSIYTNSGANFGYFNNKCGDPYTYYNYWYRRFPSQTNYLNCYNYPWVDPLLKNKFAYIAGSTKCQPFKNYGFNQNDNGFKYFVRKINYTSPP